ncbi:hypothetical protein NKH70_11740 [Mesorhizobium sp. M0991]|uniref:hypothetical protein n=1 Tax=Mesorhizobium sp. M0991 TaxID=2957043 RepID=UPI00333C9809
MDQLQKAGGPATSVGIDQNRARVRLFLMTPKSYRGSPFDDNGDPWRALKPSGVNALTRANN